MKLTAKITSIIALIIAMTMLLTGCSGIIEKGSSLIQEIIDMITGTETPPEEVPDGPSGFTVSAENGDGLLYFSGSVSEGRFNGSYRDKFATLVNLTAVDGGFIIHFVDDDGETQYIVMNDTAAGAALTTDKFQATIFEWNSEIETYVVADDANNRAFGVGKTSTYTTFSCYDVSNTTYNYAKFTPVNNPTIEKGEGGKPSDSTGGNNGGNNNGGDNSGSDIGGNGGNQGGEFGVIEAPITSFAYKFGMVQGNLDNAIYYLAGGMNGYYMATTTVMEEALDVYIEETTGGYYFYCYVGGAKTYINFVVSGTHVNGAYESTASTVYRFDTESKTLIATVNGEDYWLATRNDNTYTTMGPCKVSYAGFYGQFYGEGGVAGGDNNGGSGDNSGNQGGNNGGNNNGSDNPFAGGFELGLVPAYSASFGGYYIINNNTPYFTAEEIEAAKAECFEHYAARDELGRAVMAYACVCSNTLPKDSRGDISSVKPTGWVQKTYDCVPGGSLYNRSHLIAWSLTDEDANWENLVTGTEHMNQKVMTQFEDMVRDYVKANSKNKVLYRATPIYNGTNLVCTGILLEAYSIDDNGDDISFCVFLYNVQPGISIDYATGKSELGDEAGKNSGLAGSIVDDGNGGSVITPVEGDRYIISANNANGPLYFKGSVTSGRFDCSTNKDDAVIVTVSTVEGGVILSFQMGGATQYIIMEDTSTGGKLTTNVNDATIFEWSAEHNTYIVAEDSNSRAFGAGVSSTYNNFSPYDASSSTNAGKYNWATFTKVGTSEGGAVAPEHTCESVCPECDKCFDMTCGDEACSDKCQGHESVTPDHACESACPECGKCLDMTCGDEACPDKCQGHESVTPGVKTNVTFNLGTNGDAAHKDGDNNIADASYTETVDGYTLNITSSDKMYIGAMDAKGNSCLKLGTTSVAGDISFTVSDDVTSVIIYIGKYKANTSKITVNGTAYTLTKNSNDGQYDEIVIDTSTTKTVNLTTVSGGYRAMINTIVFVVEQ